MFSVRSNAYENRVRRNLSLTGVVVVALLCTLLAGVVGGRSAQAAGVVQGSLVNETPRRDVPIVLDGAVFANLLLDQWVFVGGSFTSVETVRGGAVAAQPYLMAYKHNTGQYETAFLPVINGVVTDIVSAGDGQHIFISGDFTTVGGQTRRKVAKINYRTGQVDPTFKAQANGTISSLAILGNRLFLGGRFTSINGTLRSGIAEVNTASGAVAATFPVGLVGPRGRGGASGVKAMDLSPDGRTLMVAHLNTYLEGQQSTGLAKVDISGGRARMTGWRIDEFEGRCKFNQIMTRDVEVSPDGTYAVIVSSGDDYPPCGDTAIAVPLAGTSLVEPLWMTRMFDSTYSVGITDKAVYVGGHFRYTEAPGSIDPFPGSTTSGYPNPGVLGDQVVRRHQLAALNPVDGKALPWDPISDAYEAVFDIEVTRTGLLLGQDRDRIHSIRTGRHAFLQLPNKPQV
ncbi:MAG: delta-60 repeat domain-containing protein [Acidimicrobiia bacterium]|nr:delta-60 repeat domain-containing protein [Acidimicrobiia bacterium]MBP8181074.1 delta-60 repeat domain-containing protein [Acidimicrobiia bacterium]